MNDQTSAQMAEALKELAAKQEQDVKVEIKEEVDVEFVQKPEQTGEETEPR